MITGKYSELSRHSWLLAGLAACALSAASAVATAATSGPASLGANPAGEVKAVHVRYGDLNLATDAGNRALYQRITHAAREVCEVGYSRDLAVIAHSRACEQSAVTQAVQAVHSPRLAAIYAQAQPRS